MTVREGGAGPSYGARALFVLGELLLTAGIMVGLYAGYLLWWTNARSGAEADRRVELAEQAWAAPAAATDPASDGTFAVLRADRLGGSWVQPVRHGTGSDPIGVELEDLEVGAVHYPRTALPGRPGNFAVAGHRATHGAPFADLDRLRAGDVVSVRTAERTYSYTVRSSEVISPDRLDVLSPVPGRPGARPSGSWLTLTTCHPRYGSSSRLAVYATLDIVAPRSG